MLTLRGVQTLKKEDNRLLYELIVSNLIKSQIYLC